MKPTRSQEPGARSQKKVVLFLPPYAGEPLGPPAGLLALAATLREAGYTPVVVDAAVENDFIGAIGRHIKDALCFGVSLLTGPMISGAVAASRAVRSLRPELPIVYGGWHPTLLAAQTLAESFVDVVVRHQGERAIVEVVRSIESGESLAGVQGCSFKAGEMVHNPDRSVTRVTELPLPAYDLVDWDVYERRSGERKLPYASSVGCPYACNYCTDTVFYNRRFNALPAERVVAEVTGLVARHALRDVALLDSNFLVDTRRAAQIACGFIDSGLRFTWTFQASTDLLCRMSDDDVRLLGRSGCRHIGFGTESASEELLEKMNKPHQRVDDMFESARKCRQAGIRTTFNLIFGFPGETDDDRRKTLCTMSTIARRFDNVTFSPNLFTPYPGIPIWTRLRELGVHEPDRLEAWTDVDLGATRLPWLRGPVLQRIERSTSYFLLSNEITKAARRANGSRVRRLPLDACQLPLRWRLKHQRFELPVELWLADTRKRLVKRRSLLTGKALEGEKEPGASTILNSSPES